MILPLSVNTGVAVRSSAQSECHVADVVFTKQTIATGPRNEAKQWHFEQVWQSTLSMTLQMQHGYSWFLNDSVNQYIL